MTKTIDNTAASATSAASPADGLYAEGLALVQAGRWKEAVRSLEQLARQRPDDAAVASLLDEARFKARLDAGSHVRARRWIIPWRAVLLRVALVAVFLLAAWAGARFMSRSFAPMLAQAQHQQQVVGLLKEAKAYLDAETFNAAETSYTNLLALEPANQEARAGLALIGERRAIADLYDQAVKTYDEGDFPGALEQLTVVSLKSPGYRDVAQRINDIKRQGQVGQLFTAAQADFAAGSFAAALLKYEDLQRLNSGYNRELVQVRLFDVRMALGRAIVERRPPVLEEVPQALEHFGQALALRPRDGAASLEQRLATRYLEGRKAYAEQRWADAISNLRAAFDERPDYLGGALLAPLYGSYMSLGDGYRGDTDYAQAWVQYSSAAGLPVADTVAARNRLSELAQFITPTPTPAPTRTPTPAPTPTPFDVRSFLPTVAPTPTPPAALASYRNQIVFFSDKEDQPGMWVMDPNGGNRRYLGSAGKLQQQYDDLVKAQTFSPDGRYRVYATDQQANSVQIFIQAVQKDDFGIARTWQVTRLSKTTYDPVWSPDGAHIAFVSQERGSDDIFTVQVDGNEVFNRTPNTWEWDKRPSWSPDSQRIVFWTNREGTKQIYVMDWQGRQQVNISKVAWDEYDPVWIK